ncbi:hypothetical protein BC831DRAFT_404058 [Entophlyctis helioformis]|nr:hypothetical protein BC831DRAFT_404058 [Entophlyctis helioformis]
MFAIIYGLKRPAVLMWTHAWEGLSSKYVELFKELDTLMDPSFGYGNYNTEIRAVQPPAVPFILPYIQDIIETHRNAPLSVDDDMGSPSMSPGLPSPPKASPNAYSTATQRINFQKHYHMYSIAAELEVFRLGSYHGKLRGDRESNLLLVNHMRSYAMLEDKALGEGLLFSSATAVNEWNETAAGEQGKKAMKRATQLLSSAPASKSSSANSSPTHGANE